MTRPNLALDSNLVLLFAVGRAERGLVTVHKRLRPYSEADYELLQGFLAVTEKVTTTPNIMTEVSNIASFGIVEPALSRINSSVKGLAAAFDETYKPSGELTVLPEFDRLGLADCPLLAILDHRTRLLTADTLLYLAALDRGFEAINFDDARRFRNS